MTAFKGVSADGTNRLGRGRIVYIKGNVYHEDRSKTVNSGFHCCENPFECLSYYDLDRDRFFKVDARGSIDEDDSERIACTEMEILEELTVAKFMVEGMKYIIEHPDRDKWRQSHTGVKVEKDVARADIIAIARGREPHAAAEEGGYIGFLVEDGKGKIIQASLKKVDGENILPGIYYRLRDNGILEVVC